MDEIPEISIIVPVYNGSRYLAETLRSLLAQTFRDFELLVIDDGSTDSSCDVARSMNDPRIRILECPNGGLAGALNTGIAEARGELIARCDQDDISVPERLERQLKHLKENPGALGIFSYTTSFGSKHVWSNADKVAMAPGKVKEWVPIQDSTLVGSSMLMRAAPLRASGGFRQEYYPCDDWDLELRLTAMGKLLVLCEPLVAYRFHSGANTYPKFALMREKARWAEASFFRRQKGLPEQTYEEFLNSSPQDFATRIRHRRKDSSALHMRIAGQRYLDGRYLAAAWHLTAASVLHPGNLKRRLKRMLSR